MLFTNNTEALLSLFYPWENSDQKSQIFIYELISLNESLFTKIYMYTLTYIYINIRNILLKCFILVLHNSQYSLQRYPLEILTIVRAFIWILMVWRQHCIELIHNTAHGQEKSNPQPQGPTAMVSNIIYKMLSPLRFLL